MRNNASRRLHMHPSICTGVNGRRREVKPETNLQLNKQEERLLGHDMKISRAQCRRRGECGGHRCHPTGQGKPGNLLSDPTSVPEIHECLRSFNKAYANQVCVFAAHQDLPLEKKKESQCQGSFSTCHVFLGQKIRFVLDHSKCASMS